MIIENATTAACLLVLILIMFIPFGYQPIATSACTLSTALLLAFAESGTVAKRLLGCAFLVWTGRVSYSLYLWHWTVLILSRWTIGADGAYGKLLSLVVMCVMTAISYAVIERPLRYAKWTRSNFSTVALGLAVTGCIALVISQKLPHLQNLNNDSLPRLFGINPVPEQEDIPCNGMDQVRRLMEPLGTCLGALRTESRPNEIYLIGDSHAAQFFYPMRKVAANGPYVLGFINMDFPFPLLDGASASRIASLNYIAAQARPGDYVVIAFHRGLLNQERDRHIDGPSAPAINPKTQFFIEGMKPFLKTMQEKQVKVLLIRDTPLMNVISPSTACALQIRLFGASICRVSRERDVHTRYRQDFAFDSCNARSTMSSFGTRHPRSMDNENWIDVLDKSGNYVMWDCNHLTQNAAEMLATDLRTFIRSTAKARVN